MCVRCRPSASLETRCVFAEASSVHRKPGVCSAPAAASPETRCAFAEESSFRPKPNMRPPRNIHLTGNSVCVRRGILRSPETRCVFCTDFPFHRKPGVRLPRIDLARKAAHLPGIAERDCSVTRRRADGGSVRYTSTHLRPPQGPVETMGLPADSRSADCTVLAGSRQCPPQLLPFRWLNSFTDGVRERPSARFVTNVNPRLLVNFRHETSSSETPTRLPIWRRLPADTRMRI